MEYIDLVLLHFPQSLVPIGHDWTDRACTDWADCRKAAWRVCHTGLEPQTSRPHTGLLLTRASLALDRRLPQPRRAASCGISACRTLT